MWDAFDWRWLRRHEPLPRRVKWSDVLVATQPSGSPSKFIRGLHNKAAWERFFERNRKPIKESSTERFYYVEWAQVMGVSGGKVTNFVKLRWSHENTIHAYPITQSELEVELRTENSEEFSRFKSEKRIKICLLLIGRQFLLVRGHRLFILPCRFPMTAVPMASLQRSACPTTISLTSLGFAKTKAIGSVCIANSLRISSAANTFALRPKAPLI